MSEDIQAALGELRALGSVCRTALRDGAVDALAVLLRRQTELLEFIAEHLANQTFNIVALRVSADDPGRRWLQ
jgi:hypothetical protein